MTSPTGNRWVNQDTGEIANPDNIQTDLPGNPQKIKYGPAVTGQGEPPANVSPARAEDSSSVGSAGQSDAPIGEPTQPFGPTLDVSPAFDRPGLGPDVAAVTAELEATKLEIRTLRRVKDSPESSKAEKAAAEARLGQITAVEYGRPDGGRTPIKVVLSRAGHGNPNKKE